MSDNFKKETNERSDLIKTVQTPLGFFVLVVLVVEAILGVVAGISEPSAQTIALYGMLAIIVSLIFIVSFLAYQRPESLKGNRPFTNYEEFLVSNESSITKTISTIGVKPSETVNTVNNFDLIRKNQYGDLECIATRERSQ